jgi:hypothetical protein
MAEIAKILAMVPFMRLCKSGNLDALQQYIADHKLPCLINGFVTSIKARRLDVVKYLISIGFDPEEKQQYKFACESIPIVSFNYLTISSTTADIRLNYHVLKQSDYEEHTDIYYYILNLMSKRCLYATLMHDSAIMHPKCHIVPRLKTSKTIKNYAFLKLILRPKALRMQMVLI